MNIEGQANIAFNFKVDDLRSNNASFQSFFRHYFIPLCTYCQIRFGFDVDLSKEIVHTAFIKLWETREQLDADVKLKAYMQKIVTNKSLDILKHQRVHDKYAHHQSANNSQYTTEDYNNLEYKELLSAIHIAIADMPEQMRIIFEMSRFQQLKYHEIALQLGISPKTVETQISRALAKLRQKIAGYIQPAALIILYISLLF